MSNADQDLLQVDPKIGLMFAAADHLIPLFQTGAIDTPLARRMAISAIEAYQPENRADFVNVARIIAFSMAALSLLGQTTSHNMAMPEKMRALGRANALNRSADQSERTTMQWRRHQETPTLQRDTADPDPEGLSAAIADAKMQADIADAMKVYLATRTSYETDSTMPRTGTPPAKTPRRTRRTRWPHCGTWQSGAPSQNLTSQNLAPQHPVSQNPAFQNPASWHLGC